MAEAYFGLRRTRKRTHPVRCPCCNSEDEPEYHANDQKQDEASVGESSHARPKRSRRNILKKEKEVNKTTGSEKTKSCITHVDNDSEKSSKDSGSRSSSQQSSPAKEIPTKMKNDKAVESVAANRNSKANISCENLEEKAVKKTEGKIPDKTEMSSKKIKKKETPVKTKKVVKNSSKKLPQHKGKSEDRQSFNVTEMNDNPSLPQNKKNKKSLPSKTSTSNSDTFALKDTTKKEIVGKEKKKGSQEQVAFESSDSTSVKSTVNHKKLVATKPPKESVEFDDSDELPLSVTKASVIETRKSSKKDAKDSKKSTTGSAEPTPRDFGTRKIRISYCNFDEVSRSKLEAFDHLFQELKKCPGYSKLTIANAVDMLTRIDKEQLKLIIKPKQSKNDKRKSSVSSSVTPKPAEQFSPPVKKKRSTSTNSEENTARKGASASTSKDKVRKSGSTSKQKIVAAQKRQEMNECQAAEALLNFKSKPAVSRSESTTGTSDTNVSCQKEDVVETKTDKQSVSTSSLATESSVIGSVSNTTVLPVTSTNLAAETLLQIQTTATQVLLPSLPITETTQSKMETVQQTISGVKSVMAHIPSSSTPQLDTSPIETSQDTTKSNKTDETTASITDQATKAMDSLAHIFDQNQRQFGGFPVQTVLPQNPNFSPITWAQTIPANIGQFSNVSTTLPSSICPLTPQTLSQLAPQAFTQMASHVFGQVVPQAKQQLLTPAVQEVLTGTTSAQPAFLPTAGQIGLGLQQTNQATPVPITEAQPNQQAAQPKSQLPLKSMEEIVGNVGQTGVPQPVGWSFQKSQTPVVYLASPQTLGGVPRNIVPATQSTSGVPLGQENMYKPISAKITTGKPELAPAAARITQGGTLSQGQTGLATVGKRPILPREQGATAAGLLETRATHRLPLVIPQVTNPIPASVQTPVASSTLVPSQQRVVSTSMTGLQSNTTPTTTLSAKQAVKNLVRERTKSAELKRQDSSGSTSSRSAVKTEPAEAGQRSPSLPPQQPRRVSESACDVTSIASTVDLTALQSPSYQGTRPNEFNLEQAASALLSIGKTESPEGNTTSQGDDNQDGQDEKVVFTSKGMFRVGDVEVDPQYNRIGREGYTCGKCGKIFTSLSYLARHIKRVCPDMSCRKWRCTQCDKAFRHPFGLQQHVYTHTGERPHKCPQCPKAFYSSNDLRRHSRIHSGERPYKCKHCEKSFATTISLKTHTYIHTGEKPHKCPHCPKTFATSSKLGRHIVTHSEQRPFSCHQCPKSFNRSGDLRRHSLHVHESNDKPFECDECNKPFATSVCLKIHKNMHRDAQTSVENEKPFKCSTCDRTYDSATQLEKHHLTHIPSAPLGYNYKQFHPIAPKPSGKLDELGSPESAETKHAS